MKRSFSRLAILFMALAASSLLDATRLAAAEQTIEVIAEGELRLDGKITALVGAGEWAMEAYSFTSPRGNVKEFDPPRSKSLKLDVDAFIHALGVATKVPADRVKLGSRVAAIGKNGADGTVAVRELVLLDGPGATRTVGTVTINGTTSRLVGEARAQRQSGQLARAISLLNEALSAAQAKMDAVGESFTYRELANIYNDMKLGEKAVENYKRAIQVAHGSGDSVGESLACNGLGVLYMDGNSDLLAVDALEKADRLAVDGDLRARVLILRNLSAAYYSVKRQTDNISAMKRLYPLQEESGDRDGATKTMLLLAIATAPGQADVARDYLSKAKSRVENTGDDQAKAVMLMLSGRVNVLLGEVAAADANYQEAAALYEKLGDANNAKQMRLLAAQNKAQKAAQEEQD